MESTTNAFPWEFTVHKKSAFMMLAFEDRVNKLRDYFRKEQYPFLGMSKEKKHDFRQLKKQFKLDPEDNFTLMNKVNLTQGEYYFSSFKVQS